MNLSKKLLLALAGTGMMAPMAASAQELASLNGAAAINDYMQQQDVDRFRAWESKNQVTSVTQFSDVQPTDWAYQALSNLSFTNSPKLSERGSWRRLRWLRTYTYQGGERRGERD